MTKKVSKVLLIAAATAGLGAAGFQLLSLSQAPGAPQMKPIPLNMDLGPIGVLSEPAGSPYESLMERAVQGAPEAEAGSRERLLTKLRLLRDHWRDSDKVASAPTAPAATKKSNTPDRL